MKGIKLPGFKISKSGKVERDEGATLAKLPVNKRIARISSKKVKVVRPKG
jgi:hypothetical protein